MENSTIKFRRATAGDVVRIVEMLADDDLGSRRERFESPLPESYLDAFENISSDPNNELVVATIDGRVVAVMQLTFIPYLTYQGGWRALIEGVRVASGYRDRGIGHRLFKWAINRAQQRGCHLVQLTTDKSRPEAMRFYENLGFRASHEGMKLHLDKNGPVDLDQS
jgi:ribosomal protein S18 acetylase RimI-like enzyme